MTLRDSPVPRRNSALDVVAIPRRSIRVTGFHAGCHSTPLSVSWHVFAVSRLISMSLAQDTPCFSNFHVSAWLWSNGFLRSADFGRTARSPQLSATKVTLQHLVVIHLTSIQRLRMFNGVGCHCSLAQQCESQHHAFVVDNPRGRRTHLLEPQNGSIPTAGFS